MTISKVAVIGSGVMGSGIAAHIANSNTEVLLLDIVPQGQSNRNALVEGALEKMQKSDPAMLTHKSKLKYIKIGNLEDDISKLNDCDWIIEVVLEDIKIKQETYKKINQNRKKGSIVSSNTSTIPLEKLVEGQGTDFEKDFLITHFFNPPRYMKLLELVSGKNTRTDAIKEIEDFCDVKLGKGVVKCYDRPGFIANRIGTFWLMRALNEVVETGASIELADVMMGKPVGIPKTGVFGLMDLIGIDLLPLIARSFANNLPKEDEFNKIFNLPATIQKMIADGYTGRKGKGGFYRINPESKEKKEKQVIDLKTGEYKKASKPRPASAEAGRKSLANIFETRDEGSKYLWPVLRDTLVYTANLVGEIASDIKQIDEAMKLGYNWKMGPFEIIDKMAIDGKSGAKYFADKLKFEGREIPKIIEQIGDNSFYKVEGGSKKFFAGGNYNVIPFDRNAFTLDDIKINAKPVLKNGSASVWDIGDGVLAFEFTSKMNSLDPTTLDLINSAVDEVKKNHKALVMYNDSDNFCVGANIGVLLFAANTAAWKEIDGIIKQGQDAYMNLKYAPFPVIGAPSGMALGGGCEMMLHCDAVVSHVELYSGLVEVGVGLVPGWGGCKEFVYRQLKKRAEDDAWAAKFGGWFSWLSPIKTLNTMPPIIETMTNISTAKVSKSAEEAKRMLILNEKSEIVMNRKRLLSQAKKKALELAVGYKAPETYAVNLPGKTARTAIEMKLREMEKTNQVTPYDMIVSRAVAYVITGGDTSITKPITEQQLLDLEREAFMDLIKQTGTLNRIEHMLDTGKPLRN
ncbi:MAG: 3-hydroxyacyl-CoA dehydrogenase NAD-binding domain-containing protein [Rickettsiales bacterium]|nr:3-hydroxyacyl-CoA dehydrogenase NAD-binding domain-containing protein [Rickettsiales bacterium]